MMMVGNHLTNFMQKRRPSGPVRRSSIIVYKVFLNLPLVCRPSVIASFVFRVVWQAGHNANASCIASHCDVKVVK